MGMKAGKGSCVLGVLAALGVCLIMLPATDLASQEGLPAPGAAVEKQSLPDPAPVREVAAFRLSQGVVRPPEITAFLEIWRADGSQVMEVGPGHLKALIGSNPLATEEVRPFQHQDDGVAYILLVDISKSLKEKEFFQMQEVLQGWIDWLAAKDQAAIMTFGTEVKLAHDFSADKNSLKQTVAALAPRDDHTQLHKGLVEALEQGRRIDPGLPLRRAIVTLSDGQDDFAGGFTKSEVLERIKVDPVPIYAIGFSSPPKSSKKEEALKVLGEFARTSGGTYVRAQPGDFAASFSSIWNIIDRVHVVRLKCDACAWDGAVRRLQMDLVAGHLGLTSGADLRLHQKERFIAVAPLLLRQEQTHKIEEPESKLRAILQRIPWYGFAGGALVSLGLLLGLILLLRRHEEQEVGAPSIREDGPGYTSSESGSPAPWRPETHGAAHGGETAAMVSPGAQFPRALHSAAPGGACHIRLTPIRSDDEARPIEKELAGRLVIGRSRERSDIALSQDPEVSREHCELSWEKGNIFISDLGSKNGTFVSGVPIVGRHRLKPDDIILVGKTELRLTIL